MAKQSSIVDRLFSDKNVLGVGVDGDQIVVYVEKGFSAKIEKLLGKKAKDKVKIVELERRFEAI